MNVISKKNIVLIIGLCFLYGCKDEQNNPKIRVDSSSKQQLVVGLSADYPPFEFYKNGQLVGFDIDFSPFFNV